ncbi:hypothetical protein BDN70DRAFT_353632 [Pholiota conissans]|uniref:Uncharacterized protein n=1 Tax=Pholiota conissans TaxID=109636 RepID=A0A9P5YSI2_9AGAR|nr:hypothetical protein BDN70DRAFT_353632 [Pholiota conissans]
MFSPPRRLSSRLRAFLYPPQVVSPHLSHFLPSSHRFISSWPPFHHHTTDKSYSHTRSNLCDYPSHPYKARPLLHKRFIASFSCPAWFRTLWTTHSVCEDMNDDGRNYTLSLDFLAMGIHARSLRPLAPNRQSVFTGTREFLCSARTPPSAPRSSLQYFDEYYRSTTIFYCSYSTLSLFFRLTATTRKTTIHAHGPSSGLHTCKNRVHARTANR